MTPEEAARGCGDTALHPRRWRLPHTTRAALTGLRKRGFTIVSEKTEAGGSSSIVSARTPEIATRSKRTLAALAAGIPLADDLASIALESLDQLRICFRTFYSTSAPEGLSRDLIARLVAHRLQEQHRGKLDRRLADQIDRLGRGQEPRRRLTPGTVLVRAHDGIVHEVVAMPNGFVWQGETFTSLSTIAKRITGTSWNGPRFFGLRQASKTSMTDTAAEGGLADA